MAKLTGSKGGLVTNKQRNYFPADSPFQVDSQWEMGKSHYEMLAMDVQKECLPSKSGTAPVFFGGEY